jgi:acetamidase/formamidase
LDVEPARDWAASTTIPLFGSLSSTRYTALLHDALPEKVWIYEVDRSRSRVKFQAVDSEYRTWIPMHPFHGTIGVAPTAGEVRGALVPEAFGGNMDSPEACKGTTVYLGVNEPGALFSLGDGHYAQGQGEVCGVAVEGAMQTSVAIELIKGRYTEWPIFENDEYMMTVGSYRPLEDAFRIALTQMVRCVSKDFGLSMMDAYQLVSQVNEAPIANVVDPNYTVVTKVAKRYLPKRRPFMNGAHGSLSRLGGSEEPS